MKKFVIEVFKSKSVLANNAKIADGFMDRLIGLMFSSEMKNFDALIIEPSNSIHTCFMKYPIDVLFLDKNNKVVKIFNNLVPWRFTSIYLKARRVVELPVGKIPIDLKIGDEVKIQCLN